jgi:hypothetical protein
MSGLVIDTAGARSWPSTTEKGLSGRWIGKGLILIDSWCCPVRGRGLGIMAHERER